MSIINREEFIKSLIKDNGLTTKEFAQKINIPYTTLLSILNRSIGGASVDNVIKICQGLNIKVDDLRTIETNNDTFDSPPLLSKTDLYSNFGQRLSLLRQKKGLSQNELAKMLNMPQSTYAGYETGKRKINLELIEQFSSFFNISPTVLITGGLSLADDEEKFSAQEKNLIKKYRDLDDRGKEAVLDTLEREHKHVEPKIKESAM